MGESGKELSMNRRGLGRIFALVVGVGLLAGILTACGSGAMTASKDAGGITVSASSEVKVVPDKARVNIQIITEEKTAEECRNANAEKLDAVLKALSDLGVADTSVQTSYANLSPQYGSRVTSSDDKDGEYEDWVITGYEMTTSLTVSDLDIDNVGAAVQACVGAGADGTNGIEYYASDYDASYNEALSKALETAKSKAEGIAKATGVGLGRVSNVVEGYQDTSYRYVDSYNMAMSTEEDAAVAGAAKTMPGQVDITAQVTVRFAIA